MTASHIVVGIDLDNTLAMYDDVFHRRALQQGLISVDCPVSKQGVRDWIWSLDHGRERWTRLQGDVYGTLMDEAVLADGAKTFLQWLQRHHIPTRVISHRSLYPARGPQVLLQPPAYAWCANHVQSHAPHANVYLEDTLEKKIQRIQACGCTHFIDDLGDVFQHPLFPGQVHAIHYTRQALQKRFLLRMPSLPYIALRHWSHILSYMQQLRASESSPPYSVYDHVAGPGSRN